MEMDIVKAKDNADQVNIILELMWVLHSNLEDLDERSVTLYKTGIQKFLLEAIECSKELVVALDGSYE